MSDTSDVWAAPDLGETPENLDEPWIASSHTAPASRLLRLGARLIDAIAATLCAYFLALCFGIALSWAMPDLLEELGEDHVIFTVLFILATLPFLALQLRMLVRSGQTIGKKLLKTRIVRSHHAGSKPAASALVLRELLITFMPFVPFGRLLLAVDGVVIMRSERRCLHDEIFSTDVVKVR